MTPNNSKLFQHSVDPLQITPTVVYVPKKAQASKIQIDGPKVTLY